MINDKSAAITQLKTICNDATVTPFRRIQAANELLARFGATQRAVPVIKSIVQTFEHHQDANLTKQTTVRELTAQLKAALKTAIKVKESEKNLEDEADETVAAVPTPSAEAVPVDGNIPLIGGFDLLKEQVDGTDLQHPWQYYDIVRGFRNAPTKTELLAAIDVDAHLHWKGGSDGRFGLGWKDTNGLFCLVDQTEYDAAWTQVVALYDRLLRRFAR